MSSGKSKFTHQDIVATLTGYGFRELTRADTAGKDGKGSHGKWRHDLLEAIIASHYTIDIPPHLQTHFRQNPAVVVYAKNHMANGTVSTMLKKAEFASQAVADFARKFPDEIKRIKLGVEFGDQFARAAPPPADRPKPPVTHHHGHKRGNRHKSDVKHR